MKNIDIKLGQKYEYRNSVFIIFEKTISRAKTLRQRNNSKLNGYLDNFNIFIALKCVNTGIIIRTAYDLEEINDFYQEFKLVV